MSVRSILFLLVVLAAPAAATKNTEPSNVHTVHVVFSHHLDVGLNEALRFVGFCEGFATKIVQEYFDVFIPRAIRLANEINAGLDHADRDGKFAYTIHPWIASLYVDCIPWDIEDGCKLNQGNLRCPSEAEVAVFDAAVRRGELLWADSPMNVNAGVVGEPGMFEGLFDIAGALNERYNLSKQARVWSNVDVPGFARSSIPLLRNAGATALSICANVGNPHQGHSDVPTEFVRDNNATMWRWHDPVSDEEILVLYHKAQRDSVLKIPLSSEGNTYGGYTRLDNTIVTTSGVALASFVAADNTGPPLSKTEVDAIFKIVRSIFPHAKTAMGSTWDLFVADIDATEVAALPRFSSAWGDAWVSGISNDPGRLATYRAITRARAACVTSGACHPHDPVVRNFTRFAAKNAEHTQGVEGGAGQPGSQLCIWLSMAGLPCTADKDWKNAAFQAVHTESKNIFPGADDSWLEDRLFNSLAVQAVPTSHPLAMFLQDELAALVPTPSNNLEDPVPATLLERSSNNDAMVHILTCNGTTLEFSSETGRLEQLNFNDHGGGGGGKTDLWSQLMDVRYITFRDEGKKGMVCNQSTCPNPIAGAWSPSLLEFRSTQSSCHGVVEIGWNDTMHEEYGAPARATVVYEVDPLIKRVNVSFTWHNKTSTRLQEAMTVFHRPAPRKDYRWEMDKLGEWVPSSNVTEGGMQYQHAIWSGIRYTHAMEAEAATMTTSTPTLFVGTLDAGCVCPVLNNVADSSLTPESTLAAACFKYHIPSSTDPGVDQQLNDSMIAGMGFNLHANLFTISGFPQWYPFGIGARYQVQDATEQFRFVIEEQRRL
jgi:hypothetical protein